jgi:SnoaL-like domain
VTGPELAEAHVGRFNYGVRTGDWEPMLGGLAEDAELVFENAPAGPFRGLAAIRKAYADQPPDDEIVPLGIQEAGDREVVVAFAWARGGTGRLVLAHEDGLVSRLTVVFDE